MKKTVLLVGLAALGGATCIDLEGAYGECVNSGRCGDGGAVSDAGSDAGNTLDAGADAGIDAGRDAGADAGTDGGTDAGIDGGVDAGPGDAGQVDAGPVDAGPVDAGPYDGGPVCSGSTRPRLRCAAPLTLVSGGPTVISSALSPSPSGFVAAWASTTVELREVQLDGGTRTLLTGSPISNAGTGHAQLALDSKGAHWVAAWSSAGATSGTCATDTSPAAPITIPGGQPIDTLAVALNGAGEVGVAAQAGTDFVQWGPGCPSALRQLSNRTEAISIAATAASAGSGFRFVEVDSINYFNALIYLSSMEADGGVVSASIVSDLHGPRQLASIGSTNGSTIITTIDVVTPIDETHEKNELGVWVTSADLSADGQPRYFFTDPGWWAVGTCGEGCAMIGVLPTVTPVASVFFVGDDPNAADRGQWDVACGVTSTYNGGSIAVASSNGKLGVLLTSPTAAKLYLCDPPPLR